MEELANFLLFHMLFLANSFVACLGAFILLSPVLYDTVYRKSLSKFGFWASIYGLLSFGSIIVYIIVLVISFAN